MLGNADFSKSLIEKSGLAHELKEKKKERKEKKKERKLWLLNIGTVQPVPYQTNEQA